MARIVWGFLRKSDGHLYQISSEPGAVPDQVADMIQNKLWVFNSVTLEEEGLWKRLSKLLLS